MALTLILALCFILAILLMLYSAVALVQDKRLFGSAPMDIVDVIRPREERFKGARCLGWTLVILSMFILVAVAVIGIWDGVKQGYGFWQFFWRCLAILYIYKAFDLVFLDWVLLQKTRFFQRYYPETEGCEGYHSYIIDWAFAHRDEVCNFLWRKPKVHDPEAPYDGYDEREDTEEKARTVRLEKQRML